MTVQKSDRAVISQIAKRHICNWAEANVGMQELIRQIAVLTKLSPFTVKNMMYATNKLTDSFVSAIEEITGIKLKKVHSFWMLDKSVDVDIEPVKVKNTKITHIKYQFNNEIVSETASFKNIDEVVNKLRRIARNKKCVVTGKPAQYLLLEVNGVKVKQEAVA